MLRFIFTYHDAENPINGKRVKRYWPGGMLKNAMLNVAGFSLFVGSSYMSLCNQNQQLHERALFSNRSN